MKVIEVEKNEKIVLQVGDIFKSDEPAGIFYYLVVKTQNGYAVVQLDDCRVYSHYESLQELSDNVFDYETNMLFNSDKYHLVIEN